jgi:hypothetical protein
MKPRHEYATSRPVDGRGNDLGPRRHNLFCRCLKVRGIASNQDQSADFGCGGAERVPRFDRAAQRLPSGDNGSDMTFVSRRKFIGQFCADEPANA